MLVFIIRRSMQSVVVLLVMSLLVFVGVYAVGNPIDILINPQADQAERAQAIASLGLDQPLYVQYFTFLSGALHGDLGLVSDGDVILALSYSGESEELLNLLPALKRRHLRAVSIPELLRVDAPGPARLAAGSRACTHA